MRSFCSLQIDCRLLGLLAESEHDQEMSGHSPLYFLASCMMGEQIPLRLMTGICWEGGEERGQRPQMSSSSKTFILPSKEQAVLGLCKN